MAARTLRARTTNGGNMDTETFEDLLSKYRGAVRKCRAAEIDAACCQTGRDWDVMHSAEKAEDKAKKALLDFVRRVS